MLSLLRKAIQSVPAVIPYLTGKARFLAYIPSEYKTYNYMLSQIEGLVTGLYTNNIGGNFIDIMRNIISGQLSQAYRQAWEDEGFTDMFMPDYLVESLDTMIFNQHGFVEGFFRDIIDARIDRTSVEPLLMRARLWANQWNTAYNEAIKLIALENGGKLVWLEGDTIEKCDTCLGLDGVVLFAKEWAELGVRPQGFPNEKLICKGGHCDCRLESTDKRRTRNGYSKVKKLTQK